MAEATKALNQKLEVPQGAEFNPEFNPECSGSDKTMAVTKQWQWQSIAALSSSSCNGLNGIRTWYPRNNKGLGSEFQSSRVLKIRRPKRCGKNNLDEEVSPKSIIKYSNLWGMIFSVVLFEVIISNTIYLSCLQLSKIVFKRIIISVFKTVQVTLLDRCLSSVNATCLSELLILLTLYLKDSEVTSRKRML